MSDLQQTVGAVIRQARRDQQMTLKDLAARATISVVYLGEIERGKKYPSSLVLERVAEALEMAVPDLLERVVDVLRVQAVPQMVRAIGFSVPQRSTTPRALMSVSSSRRSGLTSDPEQALDAMLLVLHRSGSAVA